MEKFENLISKINFKYIELDVFNRQQLSEVTKKEIGEKIELRIGSEITVLGIKSKIVEIVFTLVDTFEPISKSVDVFSNYDTSENNCIITVFLEQIN